ncbi:MAG TPA: helix-turn-helix transcriptional regulator [Verrucomicrobiae bacterium]|jgi:hypothetical protein|nr:helix-turn-helix transcriptional regulator [Verrucomicrobiae bacterium]
MTEESREPGAPEADMIKSRVRLKKARELAGKQPGDLAEFVGTNYYDLEDHNGELYYNISLGELSALSSALGIKVRDLFDDGRSGGPAITPDQLIGMAKRHLNQTGISVSEFENQIGFKIEQCLSDPSKVVDWNVDFLRWLCREIGLDWRSALP